VGDGRRRILAPSNALASLEKMGNLAVKQGHPTESRRYEFVRGAARQNRSSTMANTSDTRSQNQPSKQDQSKGGQHSQSSHNPNEQNQQGRGNNPPTHEQSVKGGQHSHSGGGSSQQGSGGNR
jgi:hypothetical protein